MAFARVLAAFVGRVLRIRRRHVVAAMGRAGIVSPAETADAMYRGLATAVVELLVAAVRDPAPAIAAIRFDPALLAELARPGPLLVLGAHTDNWELGAAAIARHRPLHVVAKRQSSQGVDRFLARLRARLGVRTIAPAGALAAATSALAGGAIVALPIDQVPDRARHGVPVRFLGATALVDRAPAVLARRTGARLAVVAGARDPDGASRIELLGVLVAGEPAATMGAATQLLERFVASRPPAWLWLHRRWRAPRPCPPAAETLLAAPMANVELEGRGGEA